MRDIPPEVATWFAGSKVVDSAGMPLHVFHGTKNLFTNFRTPAWFSPDFKMADGFSGELGDGIRDADSRVVTAYLRICNPFITNDWCVTEDRAANKQWVNRKKRAGYDGVIFTSDEGEVEYIVFDPDQIRIIDTPQLNAKATAEKADRALEWIAEATRSSAATSSP